MTTKTDAQHAEEMAGFLRWLCGQLTNGGAEQLRVEHLDVQHSAAQAEHHYRVLAPPCEMRFLLGRQGRTAEAIRLLVKAKGHAMGWGAHVDVRIVAADSA